MRHDRHDEPIVSVPPHQAFEWVDHFTPDGRDRVVELNNHMDMLDVFNQAEEFDPVTLFYNSRQAGTNRDYHAVFRRFDVTEEESDTWLDGNVRELTRYVAHFDAPDWGQRRRTLTLQCVERKDDTRARPPRLTSHTSRATSLGTVEAVWLWRLDPHWEHDRGPIELAKESGELPDTWPEELTP